jgi:hypothetical protein
MAYTPSSGGIEMKYKASQCFIGVSILVITLSIVASATTAAPPQQANSAIVLADQGSFMVGGTFVTNPGTFDPVASTPDGQTIHGDHAYVQYQIPKNARNLPLVMWHGGGQFSKTWETTPDGRDGFQNIFLRQGFSTYILDQPHRGRAGRSTTNGTINAVPGPGTTGEQGIFVRFRIGIWPNYYPGVQFSQDPNALVQWWLQQTPDTAPTPNSVAVNAVSALYDKIGPAVLITHSASGILGWLTGAKNDNVKAIYSYEPVGCAFPTGEVPAPVPTSGGSVTASEIPAADFEKLTKIPIAIIYGDNIPSSPNPIGNLDLWRGRLALCKQMVDTLKAHGGDATFVHLPDIGITGNTHFAMSDLNNVQIARLLSDWLHEKGLDERGQGNM